MAHKVIAVVKGAGGVVGNNVLDEPRDVRQLFHQIKFHRLLAELSDGRFVLPVRTSDSPADRRDANNRAKLVVMAVLSVAIAILLGGAVLADLGPGFVYPLGGLLFVNYIALIVIWRRTQ